jgi:sugar phosphate isomerase/epimerase
MLGIEPEPGNVVDSARTARRLLDELPGSRVGIILDIANLTDPAYHTTPELRQGVIREAVTLLADRIVLVHAKDRAADGSVVAPGRGVIDFHGCFQALASAGVRAPVITHGLEARDADATARSLRDCLTKAGLS